MPALLSTFMKWVLLDLHKMTSEDGETYQVNIIIKATSQFVSQCIKTVRQTNYHLQKGQPMRAALETPLNVGVVLYIYHATRSKNLANFLSDLNISTNYKSNKHKEGLAQAVLKQKEEDNGVIIPSNLKRDEVLLMARSSFTEQGQLLIKKSQRGMP